MRNQPVISHILPDAAQKLRLCIFTAADSGCCRQAMELAVTNDYGNESKGKRMENS